MATRRWLGNAVQITQVDTITVANTWATNDTVTMTINGKSIVLTIKTDTSTANVATAIKEIWNGDTQTGTGAHIASPTFADGGGNSIPEFKEITASVTGSVVTLKADTSGKPFVLTVTETTAGSGTATEATATAATGKHFWSDADNWSGSAVPVDSDVVVFQNGNVSAKYGLDQNGVSPASLYVYQSYTGEIGLPEINTDAAATPYREYRDRYLKISNSGDGVTATVQIGMGKGAGSKRLNIDLNTGRANVLVSGTGQRDQAGVPPLNLKGTHSSNTLTIRKGDVAVALEDGGSTTMATIRIGYDSHRASDAKLYAGPALTWSTLNMDGGEVEINSNGTTLSQVAGQATIQRAATLTTYTGRGGELRYNSTGTLATAKISADAVLDFSRDLQTKTVTNPVEVYGERARILDPFQLVGSLVVDLNEGAHVGQHDLGTNIRLTRGTPS